MMASLFFDYVKVEKRPGKLRFAVFALGDTSYDNFCQCGRDLDRMFVSVAPADCLPALTMTSISRRRSLAGMKRSWWHSGHGDRLARLLGWIVRPSSKSFVGAHSEAADAKNDFLC